MSFFRKTVQKMGAYVPGEQPRDRRFVKLNTNENPYPPSPRVLEALAGAIDAKLRLYPSPMSDDLRTRAARVYRSKPENVLVGNGSDDLLSMIFRACVEPGTSVAYPVPTYTLYDTLTELHGGAPFPVPFDEDYSLPEGLVEAEAPLVLLANPNSPSGTLVPKSEVERLLESRDRLIVVDEAYADFADENCLDLVPHHPNLIVLRTFSKSFSLAGLRVGLAFGSEKVISMLGKVKDSYNVNRLSAVAATAALRDLRWMEENVERIRRTRARLATALEGLGFEVLPSQANFVLARDPGRDLGPLQDTLRRRGVLVRHFPTAELRDSLRITVGTDEEVKVLLRVLRQLRKGAAREAAGANP